jgi:hypothetical protein
MKETATPTIAAMTRLHPRLMAVLSTWILGADPTPIGLGRLRLSAASRWRDYRATGT